MSFTFQPESLVSSALQGILALSPNTIDVLHYRASHAPASAFDCDDRPDYLSPSSGVQGTGIVYTPNTDNPIKGTFCPPKRVACQTKNGIVFQSIAELFVAVDLNPIYQLLPNRPKLHDRFDILGQKYYATGPALPCVRGPKVVTWKISLMLDQIDIQES